VCMLSSSTAQSAPFIQAGSISALAQSGKTRTSTLADVPAIAKSYPGFEAYAWRGVFAPAGTPKAIVSRFADELAHPHREPA
jgi:tripartite-type tricarboxylate transporter receptor subunit TctC